MFAHITTFSRLHKVSHLVTSLPTSKYPAPSRDEQATCLTIETRFSLPIRSNPTILLGQLPDPDKRLECLPRRSRHDLHEFVRRVN